MKTLDLLPSNVVFRAPNSEYSALVHDVASLFGVRWAIIE
jgi:hypothetical protein